MCALHALENAVVLKTVFASFWDVGFAILIINLLLLSSHSAFCFYVQHMSLKQFFAAVQSLLFPLAGKLIEYNWMVMCFSWVLFLVDIGVLYALCNKSVSLSIRVPCSKIAGVWHCLACEGTKWESSGQDFCVSFSLELPEIPWALAPFILLWEQCMLMLHTEEIRERLT